MKIRTFIKKNINLTTVLWLLSAIIYILSFVQSNYTSTLTRQTRRVQKETVKALQKLDRYVEQALKTPVDQWLSFDKFPEDMVIYKYNADTLQSWINLFPIDNDESVVYFQRHTLFDIDNRNVSNYPLFFLPNHEQYVNLGSKWYVTKVTDKGYVKIISALEIKTEYINQNSILQNKVNKRFSLNKRFTTVSINEDDQHIVRGSEGRPLFSITENSSLDNYQYSQRDQWIAVVFLIAGFFSLLYKTRSRGALLFTITGLTIVRIVIASLSDDFSTSMEIFSPTLYADEDFFSSLGLLLINHLYIFLMVGAVFLFRKNIYRYFKTIGRNKRVLFFAITLLSASALLIYIHYSLRSIILNSSVMMELHRLQEISLYTILTYLSYALLFAALLFLVQLVFYTLKLKKRITFFSTKNLLIYFVLISLYSLISVSYFGFKKEFEKNKIWSNKLAIDRDLGLELSLREMEGRIAVDPFVRYHISEPKQFDQLRKRLHEAYFFNISQRYDVVIHVCTGMSLVRTGDYTDPVNCFQYFDLDLILRKGLPLAPYSHFHYIEDNSAQAQYVGSFTYFGMTDIYKLYFTITPKFSYEAIGYPSLLLDNKQIDNLNIPNFYSYAKYKNNRLVLTRGRYNYPVISDEELKEGYSYENSGKELHFYNKLSSGTTIVISRSSRNLFPYLVSFSYLMLFYGAVFFMISRIGQKRRSRKNLDFTLPKNSFRRKISYLMTTAMVVALVCMGIGSILFSLQLYEDNNRVQMEEKLSTINSTLSQLLKYTQTYSDINRPETYDIMDRTANNTQVDVNLYYPDGRLLRSTRPEIFDKYILSKRMNPEAFNELINNKKSHYIQQESISGLQYHALYSAVYNNNGNLIVIINIPFFSDTTDLRQDATAMVAAIINIYLLLLLAAFFGARAVSNSITKPLVKISKKMQQVDITNKAEPIDYKSKDELGVLVKAYNEMLEDLEESSKLLAQTEREQAWREMARQIAHEIKNPLTPMRLSIQHLVRLKNMNAEGWEDKFDAVATSLLEQIEILSETATEFSSFAKFYNEENIVIDIFAIINEQLALFDNRENIRFLFISEVGKALVLARRSQVTRALVNLISNAIQAIENKPDSIIRITLSVVGKYYRIDIEDNGPGVSKENQHFLFKPNFTTKSGGTGLGLAICRSIIEQSNGNISYKKSDLGGADFIIQLPVYN